MATKAEPDLIRDLADPLPLLVIAEMLGVDPSRLADFNTLENTAIGVFRDVRRPVYDHLLAEQLDRATAKGPGDLASLLAGSDTWTVPG